MTPTGSIARTRKFRRTDQLTAWLLSTVLTTFAAIFVTYEFARVDREVFEEANRQGSFLFSTTSSQMSDSLYFNNIEQIRRDGEIMAKQQSVARISVSSESGRYLFDSAQPRVPSGFIDSELLELTKQTDTFYRKKDGALLKFVGAIRFDQTSLGVLYFELDTSAAMASAHQSVRNMALIVCMVLVLLCGLIFAVTKIQQTRRSLRTIESNFRELIEQSPLPYAIYSRTGFLLYANPAMNTLMTASNAMPFDDSYCLPSDEDMVRGGVADSLKYAFQTGPRELPGFQLNENKADEEIWVKAVVFPLFGDDTASGEVVVVFEDISGEKRAETERREFNSLILQRQKLEGLGVMARGIAHDFNNLLTPVMGNAGLLRDKLKDDVTLQPISEKIIKGAERAADLCDQLLTYGKSGVRSKLLTNMSREITEILPLVQSSSSKKIDFKLDLDPELPNILIDRDQLGQVIMNLALNATESIDQNTGVVTVKSGACKLREADCKRLLPDPSLPPGDYVFVKVIDTGCGIDEEMQKNIFDPFFSTKFPGRGLGMSVVLGIISDHLGGIEIDSKINSGSTFTAYFPAVYAEAEQSISSQPL